MAADNITQFPGAGELPPCPLQIKRAQGFCTHPEIRLDDHTRTVECVQCGATLDPFDFLRKNAITLQQAWISHSVLKQDVDRLVERVTALKKEEAKLKARIATAKKKVGGEVVIRVTGNASGA